MVAIANRDLHELGNSRGPLHRAAEKRDVIILEDILQYSPDISPYDGDRYIALDYTMLKKHIDSCDDLSRSPLAFC